MYPIIIALLIGFVIVSFVLFKYWWREESKKLDTKKKIKRGVKKEKEAKSLLRHLGYSVIEEQKEYRHLFDVDGKEVSTPMKIDYLVGKAGRRYIVEVKTGQSASVFHAPTRRQILEYSLVIPNDGVFLLDMEKEQMHKIDFSFNKSSGGKLKTYVFTFLFGVTVGVTIYYLFEFVVT